MRAASLTCADLRLGHAGELQREAHVLAHGHVRVERIGLEHHRDAALGGGDVVHPLAADVELAAVMLFEPGDHAQKRGLAAAGGADEDDELLGLDVEIDALDDFDRAEGFANAPEFQSAHAFPPPLSAMVSCPGARSSP